MMPAAQPCAVANTVPVLDRLQRWGPLVKTLVTYLVKLQIT